MLDLQEPTTMLTGTTQVLTAWLGAVAAVSLLVGGIGVMNIMLVSVTEHTRLLDATHAAQRAAGLALDAYASGLIDFLNVLEAQRSLLSFQDQQAHSEGPGTANLIRLYKALGGGWTPLTDLNTAP